MKNYIQEGERLNVVAAVAATSGVPYILGTKVVIPVTDAAIGDTFAAATKGVFALAKGSGVISAGDALYYDTDAAVVTKTAAGNSFVGYAAETVISATTEINVLLVDALVPVVANVAAVAGTTATDAITGVNAILTALKASGLMTPDA